MKITNIFFLLFAFGFANVQSKPKPTKSNPVIIEKEVKHDFTVHSVEEMAVFPGCEMQNNQQESNQIKQNLIRCFAKQLNNMISFNLDMNIMTAYAEKNMQYNLRARIEFVLNKNGEIVDFKVSAHSNELLGKESIKAIQGAIEKMKKKNQSIQPAKNANGKAVNLHYVLPVRFRLK